MQFKTTFKSVLALITLAIFCGSTASFGADLDPEFVKAMKDKGSS